jgi:hypothetical protein
LRGAGPDERRDAGERHREAKPSAPNEDKRARRRDVFRQDREGEGGARAQRPASADQRRASQQKGAAEGVHVSLPRALGDRQRMEGVEGGRPGARRPAGSREQRDDRKIGRAEERLERQCRSLVKTRSGPEDRLPHRGIHRPKISMPDAGCELRIQPRHLGRLRGETIWGNSRRRHAPVPQISEEIVGEIRPGEEQRGSKHPAAQQEKADARCG